jgi:polar amino acid transport system permease protein
VIPVPPYWADRRLASIGAALESPKILHDLERAQLRGRMLWRVKFALVWLVLIGGLVTVLWATGNIDPDFIARWSGFILGGAELTIIVCVASIILATTLALIGAMARLSNNVVLSATASLYVSLVRGTPLLVQIYFIFFALPELGVVLPAVEAGIIALGFNYGAYMTEIFRAGIQAVPRGQREAAQALGMPEHLITRRIVMPQAIRIVIPAIGNEFIAMIKDSSLVSLIGIRELLWRARGVGTRQIATVEAMIIAAAVYWILTIIFSFFQERLERRLARSDR